MEKLQVYNKGKQHVVLHLADVGLLTLGKQNGPLDIPAENYMLIERKGEHITIRILLRKEH